MTDDPRVMRSFRLPVVVLVGAMLAFSPGCVGPADLPIESTPTQVVRGFGEATGSGRISDADARLCPGLLHGAHGVERTRLHRIGRRMYDWRHMQSAWTTLAYSAVTLRQRRGDLATVHTGVGTPLGTGTPPTHEWVVQLERIRGRWMICGVVSVAGFRGVGV